MRLLLTVVLLLGVAATASAVEIVVYDGTALPATTIAGCSDPDCLGATGAPQTGTVTHDKNYVGWGTGGSSGPKDIYLYVDGRVRDSANGGQLLLWNTHRDAAGPHVLQGVSVDNFGVMQVSNPLTITVVK